jgi:hypothetical protein
MFTITRESDVSYLQVRFASGPETIATCRTWLPTHGSADTLAHCHEWNFMTPALLSRKSESIVQWLEAVRQERIDQRRNRDASLCSGTSRHRFAVMNSRKDATVPYM